MGQPTVSQPHLDILISDLEQRINDYQNKVDRLSVIVSKLKSQPDESVEKPKDPLFDAGSLGRIDFLNNEIEIRNVKMNSLITKLEDLI
jgi:hypothetical protein